MAGGTIKCSAVQCHVALGLAQACLNKCLLNNFVRFLMIDHVSKIDDRACVPIYSSNRSTVVLESSFTIQDVGCTTLYQRDIIKTSFYTGKGIVS